MKLQQATKIMDTKLQSTKTGPTEKREMMHNLTHDLHLSTNLINMKYSGQRENVI